MRCAHRVRGPEAGSAATELKTTAIEDGDAYILNGGKIFISGGNHADLFITYARFGEAGGGKNIGALRRRAGHAGLHHPPRRPQHGRRAAELTPVRLRVPRANVLVTGNAFGRLIRIYNRNRLSGVGQALGMATASYEEALEYSKVAQFGRELADFQGLQWMLADMAIQLNAARAVLYRAAEENEERELDPLQVSMAKVFIAETCTRVCDVAIQALRRLRLHGGIARQLALRRCAAPRSTAAPCRSTAT